MRAAEPTVAVYSLVEGRYRPVDDQPLWARGRREYAVPGEMPEGLARALVAAGYATFVDGEPDVAEVEQAVEAAGENAAERTKPTPKKRRPKGSGRG